MNDERGSVSVEVAMLTPAFLLLVALAAVTGRTAIAQNAIDLAAHDAARAASISRTGGAAEAAGNAAALETLRAQGLACAPRVTVDPRGFDTPVGSPAAVRVVVRCAVSFTDLALPGVPRTRELSADFTSPIDRYRARALGFAHSEASSATNPSMGGL